MILYTFIAIDCIAYAIYGIFLISLFANVKHNDKKPVIICFIYFLLDNIFSWMDTIINAKVFFEKAVFSNLEILIELIFILWLFFRFKKDSPFLGYVIIYIFITQSCFYWHFLDFAKTSAAAGFRFGDSSSMERLPIASCFYLWICMHIYYCEKDKYKIHSVVK